MPEPASPASLPALKRAVRRAPSRSARIRAIEQVVEESARPPTRFLTDVALDGDADLDVRLRAVAALGESPTESAVSGLVAALGAPSQPVVRRAAERLGTLPGTSQLEALKRVRTGNAATRDAVRWAKLFVSYRNRLGEYRVDPDARRVEPDGAAELVEVTRPARGLASELDALVAEPVFGVSLTGHGAVTFSCRGREHVCLLTRQVSEAGADALLDEQSMPAIVMQRSPETDDLVVSHVVLADPVGDGSVRLHVAHRSGAVVLAGGGRIADASLPFELSSTVTPHQPPASVTGMLDASGRLEIERLAASRKLAPSQSRMVRAPARQTAPEA